MIKATCYIGFLKTDRSNGWELLQEEIFLGHMKMVKDEIFLNHNGV